MVENLLCWWAPFCETTPLSKKKNLKLQLTDRTFSILIELLDVLMSWFQYFQCEVYHSSLFSGLKIAIHCI